MRVAKVYPISRVLVALLLALSGCSALARRDAVPVALQEMARVPLGDVTEAVRYRVGSPADQALLANEFAGPRTRCRAPADALRHSQ